MRGAERLCQSCGMTEFAEVWQFGRGRLKATYERLSDEQMKWRPFPGGHCIYEYLFHVAGAEHYWATRLAGADPSATEFDAKLDKAVRNGFLLDEPFPFSEGEFRLELAIKALDKAYAEIGPIIEKPTAEQLAMQIESPIGPVVSGREGFHRIAQHAAYHTGQIWLLRLDPRFPKS